MLQTGFEVVSSGGPQGEGKPRISRFSLALAGTCGDLQTDYYWVNSLAATEITKLLVSMKDGDRAAAAAKLMPLVYDEFRALAARHLRRERSDHTLQPTALVHEAYL